MKTILFGKIIISWPPGGGEGGGGSVDQLWSALPRDF